MTNVISKIKKYKSKLMGLIVENLNAVLYCYVEMATNSMLENHLESLQRNYLSLNTRLQNVEKCEACLPSRNTGRSFLLNLQT